MAKRRQSFVATTNPEPAYDVLVAGISAFLEAARRTAARAVNNLLTSTYWEIGRRIVEFEQGGKARAGYGEKLIEHLAQDLSGKHGRGFGVVNLTQMRKFYQLWPSPPILQTASEESSPGKALLTSRQPAFPLPWSHYVRLMAVENPHARMFYEAEAIRGSWSVRQMDRQINSQFYERTALSKRKAAMLNKGQVPKPEDAVTVAEELRDPYLLEFLDLKDEYSENDLEEALIRHLETFLLELGDDFAFVARQRRLLIDVKWFRVDLLFFHRGLRSLLLVDLKLGAFSHADAGQMHLYLNYAKEHWVRPGENPPIGLILCADKGRDEVRYALEGLPNKVLAATYRTHLPAEQQIVAEIDKTRRMLEQKVQGSMEAEGER